MRAMLALAALLVAGCASPSATEEPQQEGSVCFEFTGGYTVLPGAMGFNVAEGQNLTVTFTVAAGPLDATFRVTGPGGVVLEHTVEALSRGGKGQELGTVGPGPYDIRVEGFPIEWRATVLRSTGPRPSLCGQNGGPWTTG